MMHRPVGGFYEHWSFYSDQLFRPAALIKANPVHRYQILKISTFHPHISSDGLLLAERQLMTLSIDALFYRCTCNAMPPLLKHFLLLPPLENSPVSSAIKFNTPLDL